MRSERAWVVAALGHSRLQLFKDINVPVRSVAPYNRNLELLTGDLQGWLADGQVPVVMMSSDIKARGLADSLQSRNLNAAFCKEGALLRTGRITVISGELTAGFRFWNENWLLLTENDIFGMQKKTAAYQKQRCSAAVFLGNQGWRLCSPFSSRYWTLYRRGECPC